MIIINLSNIIKHSSNEALYNLILYISLKSIKTPNAKKTPDNLTTLLVAVVRGK
jgi:hypothetical protein